MADLFCEVQGFRSVVKFPFTGEMFPKNWVKRFLDALTSKPILGGPYRRYDMESGQIEPHYIDEPLLRIIHGRDSEEQFWMRHEVCNALKHALWLEDKRGQSDSGQVHARPQLRDQVQEDVLHG